MGSRERISIGYFIAVAIRGNEDGRILLDAYRATRSEKLTTMPLFIEQHLLNLYIGLKRRVNLPDFPIIVRAIVKKIPIKGGRYNVELVPLTPDRVAKVVSAFLCNDVNGIVQRLNDLGLVEKGTSECLMD